MARTKFDPRNKNAETLVVEWLNRTNKRRLQGRYYYGNSFRECESYWSQRGVTKSYTTYARAFRRMRERGYISATAMDKNGIIKVLARPEKVTVKMNHTHDKNGHSYQYTSRRRYWTW